MSLGVKKKKKTQLLIFIIYNNLFYFTSIQHQYFNLGVDIEVATNILMILNIYFF